MFYVSFLNPTLSSYSAHFFLIGVWYSLSSREDCYFSDMLRQKANSFRKTFVVCVCA